MNHTRYYKLLLVGLMTIVLSGCASIPEPEGGRSLIVGKIYLSGSADWPKKGFGRRADGIYKNGIVITFENIVTSERIELTAPDGQYYSTTFPDGEYRIVKLYIKLEKEKNGAFSTYWIDLTNPSSNSFKVKGKQAYNLGEIEWSADYDKFDGYYRQASVFANSFFKDGQSGWLGAKWNSINLWPWQQK